MTTLEKKLRASLLGLGVGADDTIVVAVSGGADSTALLDALVRLRQHHSPGGRLTVAHLNHRLRGEESDGDERFVAGMAARLGFPFCAEQVAVAERARTAKRNLEGTARQLRYDFLLRAAQDSGAKFVFTAHTRDDQAETILMRLLRGSGADGLRSIHAARSLGKGVILARPMLEVSRAEVLTHCEQYHLVFRTDSSNFSGDLVRNRIRHELMPMLRSFNPRVDESLVRLAGMLVEDEELLDEMAGALLAEAREERGLRIAPLRAAHPAVRKRALRTWLREARGGLERIEMSHLIALDRLVLRGQSGRLIELPGKERVVREFDCLRLLPGELETQQLDHTLSLREGEGRPFGAYSLTIQRNVPAKSALQMQSGEPDALIAILSESPHLDGLTIRARRPGDAYLPVGARHTIKLKTLMIRYRIPSSARNTHPVIVARDGRIVWSPGLPLAADFAAQGGEEDRCALIFAAKKVRKI